MKIALGCDHRGFVAKRELLPLLKTLGYQTEDFGCDGGGAVDFTDIACPLALAVASHECDLGVLIDCNGIGMTMAANKVQGVRAATGYDEFTARCARENYHCNIIGIGADLVGGKEVCKIVSAFLAATAANGHHARRIEKLEQIEEFLRQPHIMSGHAPHIFSLQDSK